MNNPLLSEFNTPFNVPPFKEIEVDHFLPAVEKYLDDTKKEIEAIAKSETEPSFENTVEALENTGEKLGIVSGILFNLNSAETSTELQEVAQKASPLLSAFNSDIKQNVQLFKRIEKVYNNREQLSLDSEQMMLLEKTYKSFIRSGAGLSSEDKARFKEISIELSKLELTFGENVLAETNDFKLVIEDENDLSGLPEDVKERAFEIGKKTGNEGKWVFTLQAPSYISFMEYADDRNLREKLFKAYMSKALKGNERDNRQLVKKIVSLRHEMAQLLGYPTYSHYVLEERMAEKPDNVKKFLDDLLLKSLPKAKEEIEEIKAYMKRNGYEHELQRWDWAYFSEKLRKEKYDLDDELIKPYFKLENVISGVFKTAEKLYGLTFEKNDNIPVYHEEVTAYEVLNEKGEHTAIFFADFFPRDGKRPGAWMTSYRSEKIVDGKKVIPHVSIVCNFTPSTKKSPSLLKFDEVKTLFHEFGHALHGMLADTKYASLSGTSVYWDFVELPSQIFENWCFEKECLDLFARHYQTGELIPKEYVDKLVESANYHEAYATVRQLSFGMLDMAYHFEADPKDIDDVISFETESMGKTDLFPPVENTSMSVQFGHIFAGGYASGYYSYKWAEVLDADAFDKFKETGIFNKETARSFRDNILSQGGTQKPMDIYVKFRGKKPTPDALLKRAGLN